MEVLEVLNCTEKTQWALSSQGFLQRHEGAAVPWSPAFLLQVTGISWFIPTFLNEITKSW